MNSLNSENPINHSSMNWAQFKDPVFHMCLADAAVASRSLTQWVAGSIPFKHKYLVKHVGKTPLSLKSTPLRNLKFYSPVAHVFNFPLGKGNLFVTISIVIKFLRRKDKHS